MSPEDEEFVAVRVKKEVENTPLTPVRVPPLPEDIPDYIRELHTALSISPYLDTSQLLVTRPLEPLPAPSPPPRLPKGRRRLRGGSHFGGEGIDMPSNGIWSWYVLAQVCIPL